MLNSINVPYSKRKISNKNLVKKYLLGISIKMLTCLVPNHIKRQINLKKRFVLIPKGSSFQANRPHKKCEKKRVTWSLTPIINKHIREITSNSNLSPKKIVKIGWWVLISLFKILTRTMHIIVFTYKQRKLEEKMFWRQNERDSFWMLILIEGW